MLQNVIAGLQGIIDHAMVGHFVGYTANAAIGVLVFSNRARASSPNAGPSPWPNDESGVGIGENVLVSCLRRAATNFRFMA